MLRTFQLVEGSLRECTEDEDASLDEAVWIDVYEPDDAEKARIESLLGGALPDLEFDGLEASARCYVDATGLHVRSLFVTEHAGRHLTETVACVLQPDRLVTVRPGRLRDFRILRARSRRGQVASGSAQDLLLDLLEQKIDNFAELLESIQVRLEDLGRRVLETGQADLNGAILDLAHIENSNGKIRLALTDTQRSALFLGRHFHDDEPLAVTAGEIAQDAATLLSHSTFLFERINFLMSTTQGFINIEQNKIIKMFSIAAVVFLPPTLVASIYGMNFDAMPELEWGFGYLWALALMVVAGIAPYFYFKRKGWL